MTTAKLCLTTKNTTVDVAGMSFALETKTLNVKFQTFLVLLDLNVKIHIIVERELMDLFAEIHSMTHVSKLDALIMNTVVETVFALQIHCLAEIPQTAEVTTTDLAPTVNIIAASIVLSAMKLLVIISAQYVPI
jgi:hypothetical protein